MYLLQAEEEDESLQELETTFRPHLGSARHPDSFVRRDEVKGIQDLAHVALETHVRPLHSKREAFLWRPLEDALVNNPLIRDALSIAAHSPVSIRHPTLYGLRNA